jgi:hypothetical protein
MMQRDLHYPSAERLAAAVAGAVRCDRDCRTLSAWAREIGASRGTLRAWCHAAGASPRAVLDLARLVRLVCRTPPMSRDSLYLLDTVDPRTIVRLCERGGLTCREVAAMIGRPALFLAAQRFLTDPVLISAMAQALPHRGLAATLRFPARAAVDVRGV